MPFVSILATSLKPNSRSQQLARLFATELAQHEIPHQLIDFRDFDALPLPGAPSAWEHPAADTLAKAVLNASHVVFAAPIYCYDLNAVAKVAVELAGKAFTAKPVAFLTAAGGKSSYMAPLNFANHLMLDFRSIILPRFVYTTYEDWIDDVTLAPECAERLSRLRAELLALNFSPQPQPA